MWLYGCNSGHVKFAELTQEVANGVIGLLLGGTLIVIIGLIDDYKNLPAKVKLLGQILAACVVVYFDVRIDVITDPLEIIYIWNIWLRQQQFSGL